MEHHRTANNDDEEELVDRDILEQSTDDIEEDNHELSVTPVPESINDDDEIPVVQVDENAPQQQQQQQHSSSSVIITTTAATSDDNESSSTTTKTDETTSANLPHTLRENQQIAGRISPISGPGLAKPLSMTSSTSSTSSSKEQHRPSPPPSAGKKRVDAALEKNIETIVTQVRRTTSKPSQLTQNDLELFDSTPTTTSIKNGHHHHHQHHSREITPTSMSSNSKQLQHQSSSSREMTPDSINTDSAPEDQPIRNGHRHYPHHHSQRLPPPNIDLNQYGQPPWPPVYPFQHPGLYLPYPPPTTTTPTNGVPPFYSPGYPSYDPLLIEQHYGSQALSAYYAQQQQQAANARVLQEHVSLSDNLSSTLTTPTKEYSGSGDSIKSADSLTDIRRKKKSPLVNNNNTNTYQTSSHPSINGSLSKLSPDLSSDGGTNDVDSIISLESQKSNVATTGMPILEDGLSDSECISGDELSPPIITTKNNGRHQSTQSDFLFDANHPSLTSHKRQFAKSISNRNNDLECQIPPSQSKSFYIRPPPPSSLVRPTDRSSTPPSNWAHQPPPPPPAEERSRNGSSSTTASAAATDEGLPKPPAKKEYDTDEETDKLLGVEHRINVKNQAIRDAAVSKPPQTPNHSKPREVITKTIVDPENSSVLIEGVLFRCRYLGSTQLLVEGNPTKASRMMQAQEAVSRIKAPEGESQPSVEVDLFISTEKIMVLNTDLQDILMDHSLRSISYIADIGDLVVLMAKRRYLQHTSTDDHNNNNNNNASDDPNEISTRRLVSINQKMICHVFESDEAQSVAHSIGQAFQVAYVEFLKANGIDDPSFARDIDYQEVLNQQEIGSEELDRFSKKECQKEVILPKAKNEPLGIVIVESGWGSMLPTVVIANMMPGGPAARCGHLNIGDQIISVNGISLVGLPLSSCQTQIKSVKHLTTVRLVVVPCPPVVEVLIRRPDTKYQLGFSVQNGIICSLLRGGIAERGGVRVGHRIIEINGQSVVATQHERIVSMLSNSIGELRMKTMPTQMYRLLTGQENPTYI